MNVLDFVAGLLLSLCQAENQSLGGSGMKSISRVNDNYVLLSRIFLEGERPSYYHAHLRPVREDESHPDH
jgi:hypothetical protein